MGAVEWTPIIVAFISLGGSIFVFLKTREPKADPATLHVQRADQVVDIQAGEIQHLASELEASRKREDALEQAMRALEREFKADKAAMTQRVEALEAEVLRLGGDPGLVLVN